MQIHKGSGNVFEDLALAYPERVLVRAQIMFGIAEIIKERKWTQKQAAKAFGIPQSKISCLLNGKLSLFSLDTLFRLLNALDRDVEIVIKPKARNEKNATTQVFLAAS